MSPRRGVFDRGTMCDRNPTIGTRIIANLCQSPNTCGRLQSWSDNAYLLLKSHSIRGAQASNCFLCKEPYYAGS